MFLMLSFGAGAQRVGIGTGSPAALLHISDSNVVFTGPASLPPGSQTNYFPPVQGAGTRMMWYPQRAAFRSGFVDGTQWNKSNTGLYSFATGFNTIASEEGTFTAGGINIASAQYASALGFTNVASGGSSLATGALTLASGEYALSTGYSTTAAGNFAAAFGHTTTASGFSSVAMGKGTKAKSASSLVIGEYNDTSATNRVFEIGNGTADNARKNVLTVLANGNVGIGISAPAARLHIIDSNVVFTGPGEIDPYNVTPAPVEGPGTRTLWYAPRAAFRTGKVTGSLWNRVYLGNYSFASGLDTKASGQGSFAIGNTSYAEGDFSFSGGANSVVFGNISQAFGKYCFVTGDNSLAMGDHAFVSNNTSFAFGKYAYTNRDNSFVLGSYNDYSAQGIFEIGNGTADNNRKNALAVLANGNIGIGTTPRTRLDVVVSSSGSFYHPNTSLGVESSTNHYINLITNNDSETGILFGNSISYADGGITYTPATAPSNARAMTFRTANTTPMILYNNGNLALAGTLYQNSDAVLKKNITPLSNSLHSIQQLSGYTYNWKDETRDSIIQIGLIAQELQKVYPQLVRENSEGVLSVNYSGLIPVLIEGIKEQQNQIEQLRQTLHTLLNKSK